MKRSSLKRLVYRLRPRPSGNSRQTLKDRALALRLYRTFEHDLRLAPIRGIHFYVQHSAVTLYGTVRHDLDRELLVSLVRQIPGVKAVVEHLQVVHPAFQDPDAELTFHLEGASTV